jgi:hypothetical protein
MPKRSDNVKTWLENITVTQPAPEEEAELREQVGVDGRKDVTDQVCYGCYTLFRASRGVVEWPV